MMENIIKEKCVGKSDPRAPTHQGVTVMRILDLLSVEGAELQLLLLPLLLLGRSLSIRPGGYILDITIRNTPVANKVAQDKYWFAQDAVLAKDLILVFRMCTLRRS